MKLFLKVLSMTKKSIKNITKALAQTLATEGNAALNIGDSFHPILFPNNYSHTITRHITAANKDPYLNVLFSTKNKQIENQKQTME